MKEKKYLAIWFATVLLSLSTVATFNYLIDPLWCFSHSNAFNNRQPGFNERQQKTNRAYFAGLENYDTLLLGSSRTAYINQHDFEGMRVFNYAADNMMPKEYEKWIEIAKEIKGGDFDTIIIGIDFFGTAGNYDAFFERYYKGLKPEDYFLKTKEPLYRFKSLLSIDVLKQSLESIRRIKYPTISDYDRSNVRHCSIRVTDEEREKHIKDNIEEYRGPLLKAYRYREEWKSIMKRLKEKNPHTRFIIFTTPVSEPFFKTFIVNGGHLEDYKRWLRETVEVFGKIHHFMDLNSVTTNLENFFDAHHLYEESTRMIAKRLSGDNKERTEKDFGKIITPDNIDEYLKNFPAKHYGPLP